MRQVWPWSFLNLNHMSTVASLWRKSPYFMHLHCTHCQGFVCHTRKHPIEPCVHSLLLNSCLFYLPASLIVSSWCLEGDNNKVQWRRDSSLTDRKKIIIWKHWWSEFYMSWDFKYEVFLEARMPKRDLPFGFFYSTQKSATFSSIYNFFL